MTAHAVYTIAACMTLFKVAYFIPLLRKESNLTYRDFANIGKFRHVPTVKNSLYSEAPGTFEGDMKLAGPLEAYLKANNTSAILGNSAREPSYKWPNAIIPYTITDGFRSDERARIAEAISTFWQYTCIRFIPRTTEADYVTFYKTYYNTADVGKRRGKQYILIADSQPVGTIMHEMMHLLGFFHEQSRSDRDDYISIHTNNIMPWAIRNFRKYDLSTTDNLGTPYDYDSVMHYANDAFGIRDANGKQRITITPRQFGAKIGQREGLSNNDIKKLQLFYNC